MLPWVARNFAALTQKLVVAQNASSSTGCKAEVVGNNSIASILSAIGRSRRKLPPQRRLSFAGWTGDSIFARVIRNTHAGRAHYCKQYRISLITCP